ncbi:MAG: hypothetical protein WC865_06025 [Bacteroidales bacterium]
MKLSGFILLIILILPISLFAQEEKGKVAVTDSANLIINRLESGTIAGKVKVIQDPRLTSILRKHFEFNKTSSVPGWRILIYKGREMSRANQLKAEFEEAFNQLSLQVNVEYNEPDFSTLVGTFRTKEDAYRYKQMLIVRFPQAYLVQTRITLD